MISEWLEVTEIKDNHIALASIIGKFIKIHIQDISNQVWVYNGLQTLYNLMISWIKWL